MTARPHFETAAAQPLRNYPWVPVGATCRALQRRSVSIRLGSWIASLAATCLLTLAPSPAEAQSDEIESRAVARRMAEQAASHFDNGKFEEARDLFHRANQLHPAPTLEFWEARSLDRLGRLLEAEELYTSVQRYKIRPEDPEVVRAAIQEAGVEVEVLRKRIPTLTIQLLGANPNDPQVAVELDGKRLKPAVIGFPKPVDAGSRTLRLLINGREVRVLRIDVKEGDRTPVELRVLPEAPPAPIRRAAPPPPFVPPPQTEPEPPPHPIPWYQRPAVGWTSLGIGATGIVVGTVTGLISIDKHNTLVDKCPNDVCPPPLRGTLDSFHTYKNVSTASFVVGAIGVAAGVTLLWIVPAKDKSGDPQAIALSIAPGSAALMGRF